MSDHPVYTEEQRRDALYKCYSLLISLAADRAKLSADQTQTPETDTQEPVSAPAPPESETETQGVVDG